MTRTIITEHDSNLADDEFVCKLTAGQAQGIIIYVPFSIVSKLKLGRGDLVKVKITKGKMTFISGGK